MIRPIACLMLVLAALAAAAGAWAQGAPAAAQYPIGSRLGLEPPPGMTLSKAFPGFEDAENRAYIRLVELPEQAFGEIEKTLTADILKKQGMTMDRRETLAVAGGNAILLSLRQTTPAGPIRKWMLVGPVPGRTAMVSMEFPVELTAYSDAAIRRSFATVAVRDDVPADEKLALAPFRLGDLAGFRVGGVVPGRAVHLTDSTQDAIDSVGEPHLIAGVIPGQAPRPDERDSFARMAFTGLPALKDLRITGSESMRIAGQQGHELRAEARDAKTGIEVQVVQWLRFGTGAHVRVVGFAPKQGWTETFSRFRAVRDGIATR